jgi:tripeptide aminopeptidase
MSSADLSFDVERANARLLRFLAVEGITGQEKAIAEEVTRALSEAGVPSSAIRQDTAHQHIPLPTQTGNLIVTLPGNRPGPRVLFMTHLDTVPLCAGVVPEQVSKTRIQSKGPTALGGDNRTGVGVLVTLVETLLRKGLPHPPLTLLFTVREESGLWGARYVEPAELGNPVMGFNVDGRLASEVTIGAVGAQRWEATIVGKAAHAGGHPEKGISATLVAALALAEVRKGGWFGKVQKKAGAGTSNIGSFGGKDGKCAGAATNVVTDYAELRGETRSHDNRFVKQITQAYKNAFALAAAQVRDDRGRKAKVTFTARQDYFPFKLKATEQVVRHAQAGVAAAGLEPVLTICNGGLDANWLVRHGVPTITIGAGQNNIHTIEEYVDLPRYQEGCRVALALATHEG